MKSSNFGGDRTPNVTVGAAVVVVVVCVVVALLLRASLLQVFRVRKVHELIAVVVFR
jgi:hypothetical protein